jgi:hypothetical protein
MQMVKTSDREAYVVWYIKPVFYSAKNDVLAL